MKNVDNFEIYAHKDFVLGEGSVNSSVFLVGEAPGGEEEIAKKPFVGKAGKNLDEFLKVLNLHRKDIYITNVVKIRPTKISPKTGGTVNRPPTKAEIKDFLPLLKEEIKDIKPKIIVTLGNVPLKAISGDEKISIGEVHGKLLSINGLNIFPLYHPAAIIYNQSLKSIYNEDLEILKKLLDNFRV
ncbi:MAG: uracil-DNA glycosylase [Anaerotignaceae bacterium]